MDLLPKTSKEFGSVSYWERFFRQRGHQAFEWYGEYQELCGILHKYIKTKDKVLHIGCGNSKLSVDMFDIGYKDITNIDISETVIKQMNEKYKSTRSEMKFLKMDMCKMDFTDGEFNVVLDKGTLDAIFTDTSDTTLQTVENMFDEIHRVLRLGGRFVCISLAQEHILNKIADYFPKHGWLTRVCYVTQAAQQTTGSDFHMPVFAYVFTKFKAMPGMNPILEIAPFEDKVERLESKEKLIEAVKNLQNYGLIRQQLNKGTHDLEEHISLDLYNPDSDQPRYTLYIVDSKEPQVNKFAIFIVPQGRENETMFSDKSGRERLCESARFQRLIVVTLHRQHTYESMEQVKEELSSKVIELAPEKVNAKQVPYLSLGDSICLRTVRFEDTCLRGGSRVVEDVQIENETYRRLVYLDAPQIIQTEIRLRKDDKSTKQSRKKRGKQSELADDTLCQPHHVTTLAAICLIEQWGKVLDDCFDVLMIGVKSSPLATYLHTHLPKAFITIVEPDSSLVDIATNWFGLKSDTRLQVCAVEESDYLAKISTDPQKHLITMDHVHSSSQQPNVVKEEILQQIESSLHPSGVFILNVSNSTQSLTEELTKNLRTVFSTVYSKKNTSDKSILFISLKGTSRRNISTIDDTLLGQLSTHLSMAANSKSKTSKVLIDLSGSLEDLKLTET